MTAGDLASHFAISRPAMSAHFTVLREADLIASDRVGKTIVYRLRLSVLEEAMLAFARAMNLNTASDPAASASEAGEMS